MKNGWKRNAVACFLVIFLIAAVGVGCGKGTKEKVVITIGNITDFTGPASTALIPMTWAMEDMVRYFNDGDLVPGAKIRIASYDARYDHSRDIPGYEWVKARGARVISTPLPSTALTLRPFADRDKVPLFTWGSSAQLVEPPGWVFCYNATASRMTKTLLKWISEEHWDYDSGIPRVGMAGWSEAYQNDLKKGVEQYCQAHPDQFDYVGSYLAPMGATTWTSEIGKLKNCDYVITPSTGTGLATFIRDYRDKGYTGTFIGLDAVPAYTRLLVDMCGWNRLDGSLTIHGMGWSTDQGILTELAVDFANRYHAAEAQDLIANTGWISAVHGHYLVLDIVRRAVQEVGAEHFNGQAFYDAAVRFDVTYEGHPQWSYSNTDRTLTKFNRVYEWRAEASDLVSVSDWLPIVD
ncbi:MAG: ABC transporter substrate-binding protein [Chloroflexi bacterium]|nr:ABC transporter substrate-binding protein [Chloroflexota bacterium]